jgi:hypothetical protein
MGRKTILFAICCVLSAPAVFGSELFGTVSENDKPLAQGAVLKLECGDASASGVTDQFGAYSLKTAATGDCRLTLTYKGSSPSLKVTLYEKPSRYDLVVKEDAGKITLARK